MSEPPMLFQKVLERALGPLDAQHLAHVITIATSSDGDLSFELMEHEFLLFLLIHEIKHKAPVDRSLRGIYDLLNPDDVSPLAPILQHTDGWKQPNDDQGREMAIAGVKDRLEIVLLADATPARKDLP